MSMGTDSPGWLRYPAISPDGQSIVFTYKGDLYRVPAIGGHANQLTTHEAQDFMPVWSPDGKQLAFASDRHGNFDVFIMPSEGGLSRRLTLHSANEFPTAFSPDGKNILFTSTRGSSAESRAFPHDDLPQLYQVPVAGGRVSLVLPTYTEAATYSPEGRFIVYQDKRGVESPWRKHHTSSNARDLWVYDTTSKIHRRLTDFPGEDRNPVVTADSRDVYFLSESSGSFNVHRMPFQGGPSVQVTHFKQNPVRFLSMSKEGVICFGYDGAIYTQKPGQDPHSVPISILRSQDGEEERALPIQGGIKEMVVSPSGKDLAFIVRGQVFLSAVEGGVARRISTHAGLHRDLCFSPDGKALVYASERNGRWSVYETRRVRSDEQQFHSATLLKENLLIALGIEAYQPSFSPDGREMAFIENRTTLKVFNLESRQARTLLGSIHLSSSKDGDQYYRWGPDGRWILFNFAVPGKTQIQVGLVSTDGKGEVVDLTRSGYTCQNPLWIQGGQAVMYNTNRDGMRAEAHIGGGQSDVYGMFLSQAAWDRFRLTKVDLALLKESEGKKDAPTGSVIGPANGSGAKEGSVSFDLVNRSDRTARLTTHSSMLGDALVSADGETLYYLARFERGLNLWSTQLRTKETRLLVTLEANVASLGWDREQKNLFLLADGVISKIDPMSARREPIQVSGEIPLNAAAERRAMFDHVWRRVSSTFYDRGFHGADWKGLRATYEKHLAHVGTTFEFAELLSEMLGELNVSHSGAYLRKLDSKGDATGCLGLIADHTFPGPGIRIAEVLKGGPLDKATVKAPPGTILESIDGEPLSVDRDWAGQLNRKAGKRVLLTLKHGEMNTEVVVRPISTNEENLLLYERWVRRNREEVDRLSGGKLGYVHIRNSFDRPFRAIVDEILGKANNRKGIVVDNRYNPGGMLTSDLMMFLTGTKLAESMKDGRSLGGETGSRWVGPSVLLANEGSYSDGSGIAAAYKLLGIGKLVGTSVPGTYIWSNGEPLQDDAIIAGAPVAAMVDPSGKVMEGVSTEPDIKIFNSPEALTSGRDPQLEEAVKVLLEETRTRK